MNEMWQAEMWVEAQDRWYDEEDLWSDPTEDEDWWSAWEEVVEVTYLEPQAVYSDWD